MIANMFKDKKDTPVTPPMLLGVEVESDVKPKKAEDLWRMVEGSF